MITSKQATFVSYLDLISCTFGGALLLFLLIAASGRPDQKPFTPGSLVLVRCFHLKGPQGELGLEVRRPGKPTWERVQTNGRDHFFSTATSEPNSGADAIFVLLAPEHGAWQFRPFLADFPRRMEEKVGTSVRFDWIGQGVHADQEKKADQVMLWPGDTGPTFHLEIRSGR